MTILCPVSLAELQDMLTWAVKVCDGPVALRYPRGGNRGIEDSAMVQEGFVATQGLAHCHARGEDLTILTYGTITQNVMEAALLLSDRGIKATVLRLLTVAPLPVEQIAEQLSAKRNVLIVEETCRGSGIREALAWELSRRVPGCHVEGLDLGEHFVTHGSNDKLYRHLGLDGESIAKFAQEVFFHEN